MEKEISFNDMPQALAYLIDKVEKIETLLGNQTATAVEPADRWFNLEELCAYLPDRPARQTVYGWISQRVIPYHKKGKKLQFLKSEIDNWLLEDQRQTLVQVRAQARLDFQNKKGGLL